MLNFSEANGTGWAAWMELHQPMPGRNWCQSVDSHVHPYLQEQLLLTILNFTCDNVSFRMKQDKIRAMKATGDSL